MTVVLLVVLVKLSVVLGLAGAALAFGGPRQPGACPSITSPFQAMDYTNLLAIKSFPARDGTQLTYRDYLPSNAPIRGSVVLVHGSSASSASMHAIASAFCLAGYAAHALDIRGHGKSGIKGQIAYIGQLEDDLEDFMQAVNPAGPSTLIGFSSGGGFVLRFASCPRQDLFSSYVLLSPFLHHRAPTQKRNSGGWVSVGIPRIAALTILNRLGVTSFNSLPIIRFALPKEHETDLTPAYSFSLQQNFRPRDDYMADIRHVHQPMAVVTAQMTVTAKTREASFIAGQIL